VGALGLPSGLPQAAAALSAVRAHSSVRPSPEVGSVRVLGSHPPLQASYEYDRALRQVVVTLTMPDTGGVVRQIPPEKVLRVIMGLLEVAGQFLDAHA